MNNCSISDCTRPVNSRTLCKYHYGLHWKQGTLDSVTPKQTRHSLSSIDKILQTGNCTICGDGVSLVLHKPKNQWRCRQHESIRKRNYRAKAYGFTREAANAAYDSLWILQEGKCAICKNTEAGRQLALDHCHQTNTIRGLLCTKCNTGLGLLGDSIDGIQSALDYLKQK